MNTRTKLIISTGDISDVDGFFALKEYAKQGHDTVFLMNYPAYIGIKDDEPDFAINNPGLGYKYNSKPVLGDPSKDSEYYEFMKAFQGTDAGECMKNALTHVAFTLATQVWNESDAKGKLFFMIGGINKINPFSSSKIKNDCISYIGQCKAPGQMIEAREGAIYDMNGQAVELDWERYNDMFMDFNGSMAFWNEDWEKRLKKLRGVFVMGGVYSDETPITMPGLIARGVQSTRKRACTHAPSNYFLFQPLELLT